MVATSPKNEAFFWGEGGAPLTLEQIAARRKVENALMGKVDTSPVGHWTQGAARVAEAVAAAFRRGELDTAEEETRRAGASEYDAAIKALTGGSAAPTSAPVAGAPRVSSIPMTGAAGEVSGTSPRVATVGVSALPDATELNAYLADESRRATLPAGMRNNNPGNIKFVGQKVPGIVGPSVNTDQGDPQAVFDTPESGMRAMHSLLLKKYNGGKLTPNQIIAGNMGWTPGNFQAAANVARYAGIGPDDDIGLNDPTKAAKFMRGLMMQEHGKSSNLYPDSMILSALTNGAPTQVASLDPSAGMPPAAAAIEAAAPQSGYINPMVSVQPNAAVPSLDAPQTVSPAPAVASVPTQEVAQNGQYPTPPAPPSPPSPPQAPSQSPIMNEALLRAISSPYMTDGQRSVVQMLIQQQMQQQQQSREEQQWRARQDYQTQQQRADPAYQLEQDYKREQLNALRNKTAKNWQKLDDNTLFNPDTGETMPVGSPASAGGKFRFEGKSVEAQALNGLMEAGQLTEGQAQQLGAGKTITGPNGEIIFMTPQGVFGKSADGTVSPMSAPQPQAPAGGVDIFGGAPMPPTAPTPPIPPQVPERTGMLPLTAPKVTVDESKAGGFADRMTQSGKLIDTYGNAGLNAFDQSITNSPYVPGFIANSLVGDDFQKYDQARRDFINAQLRRESGAVISPDEFDNANRQYFPQPGDKPEVLEQKRKSRETVINAMIRDAGPTYKKRGSSPELDAAREAIAKGAPKDAVIKRLRDNGIDPEGL